MANKENIQTAINILKRVDERGDNFDLRYFQRSTGGGYANTEAQAHTCGTAACFAGWIALSPEWQEQDNIQKHVGAARYEDMTSEDSIAHWLDISPDTAHGMIYTGHCYGKAMADVTVCDVIEKLEELKNGNE